jgi:hypothetical protein
MYFFSSAKDSNISEESIGSQEQEQQRRVKWSPDVVDNNVKYGNLRYPVMISSSELVNVSLFVLDFNKAALTYR